MTATLVNAAYPIADAGAPADPVPLFFDAAQTIISQYANSSALRGIIEALNFAIDRQALFDAFVANVWDVNSARGFGLDILGRIVGVTRFLYVAQGEFWGFSQADDARDFYDGAFYRGARATGNYALSDTAFRRVILAKAALNITDGSSASINAVLMALFPDHGNCYVRDNLNMTMTYVFGEPLSAVEYAIVTQSGVLPKPVGVSVDVEQP